MVRVFLIAALAGSLVAPASAQTVPAPYELPFASEGNVLELALDLPSESTVESLMVTVAAAPSWIAFAAREVPAESVTDEVLARLAFNVDGSAPIGESAEIVLHVLDAAGAIRAETRIAVEVAPPTALTLGLPHPNPARGVVTLPYVLPSTGRVTVDLLDVLGRRVRTLAAEERPAGAHEAAIDTSTLAAGAYVVRLVAEDAEGQRQQQVQRLTVAR